MSTNQIEQLISAITPWVQPLGYEIVHIEIQTHRQKTLRLFIDRLASSDEPIGVEDCVKVSRALDEPLEQMPEIENLFHDTYELEVSSPGVERPLRQAKDFERFSGQEARIHVFRPLTADELGNPQYHERNPRQKNFLGVLRGMENGRVLLALRRDTSKKEKKAKAVKSAPKNIEGETVAIPLTLISKANLEPEFEILDTKASRAELD